MCWCREYNEQVRWESLPTCFFVHGVLGTGAERHGPFLIHLATELLFPRSLAPLYSSLPLSNARCYYSPCPHNPGNPCRYCPQEPLLCDSGAVGCASGRCGCPAPNSFCVVDSTSSLYNTCQVWGQLQRLPDQAAIGGIFCQPGNGHLCLRSGNNTARHCSHLLMHALFICSLGCVAVVPSFQGLLHAAPAAAAPPSQAVRPVVAR